MTRELVGIRVFWHEKWPHAVAPVYYNEVDGQEFYSVGDKIFRPEEGLSALAFEAFLSAYRYIVAYVREQQPDKAKEHQG